MARDILLLNVAALSKSQLGAETPNLVTLAERGASSALIPPLGALTCPSQITMVTGQEPSEHGVVDNGWYDRSHGRVFNWNRSNHLVESPLIFDALKAQDPDAVSASLFWRHTAHSTADLKVIERPTYWASGRKTFDFYTEPGHLHDDIKSRFGDFPFPFFWGPLAGWKSTEWILAMTEYLLKEERPRLTVSYAPFLDYDGQRFGPGSPEAKASLRRLDSGLEPLLATALALDIDVAIISDYGFVDVQRPIFLNRVLREHHLVSVHDAQNGEVLEPGLCRAFAHCDNQIAHVYVQRAEDLDEVRRVLTDTPGVKTVLGQPELKAASLDHPRTGDLVCIAERDAWFAYPYWLDERKAPDFERCIAIFDKPGFDPCELNARPGFLGKLHLALRVIQKKLGLAVPFDVIDSDPTRIGGARNADQTDAENGALLITSWPRDDNEVEPMSAVHNILMSRIMS